MNIFLSPYQLQPKISLNAKSGLGWREGCLVKVVEDEYFGVADLFTWPEFGDDSWQEEIKNNSTLFRRALELATIDLKARQEKRSLLQSNPIENNFLVLDFLNPTIEINKTVKIKGNYEIQKLADFLNSHKATYRIDFNSILSVEEFDDFLNLLNPETIKNTEYIEDPTVWNNIDWNRWNKKIPLALDWSTLDPFNDVESWTTLVVKPNRQNAEVLLQECRLRNKSITVTSSMGHPVGLMHDLAWVQRNLNSEGVQGLLTLDAYEKTPFHAYLKQNEAFLAATEANLKQTGIGMTEAITTLSWSSIREF